MAAPSIIDYVATDAEAGTPAVSPQSYDVTLPSYSAGDLVIIHIYVFAFDLGTPPTPTGWTLRSVWTLAGSGVAGRTATFTRIMDGSEGTTVHFSKATLSAYNWKSVASSWADVSSSTPISSASSNSSGGGTRSTTWSLGTISGGFVSVDGDYWGGQYLRLNSIDGTSYTEIGTLTVQMVDSSDDITTAFSADYDVLDTSDLLVGDAPFRFALVRQAATPGHGARIWQRF